MYICGIDPGLAGALAILDDTGALVSLYDTPVLTLSTKSRHEAGIRLHWHV
jgi:predicted RNase H-like nuclease (RuvC/YqgF family)